MTFENVTKLLLAKTLFFPENFKDTEIEFAGASDLMSDFLAFSKENMLLITGLTSPQTITTAAVVGATGIIFVRGKEIPDNVVEVAQDLEIPVIVTDLSMYIACSVLYNNGIKDAMGTDRMIDKNG
ncbi:MAG: hypothetical protein H7A30_06970 [Thermotogae bacterium]|nr:hypothetical protein [Thermotogota bacterium]